MRRQIDFDEETDQILAELAQDYEGDRSKALAELVRTHKTLENFVEECEKAHSITLKTQVERAERGFREGNFTPWDEVKRRNKL